MTSQQMKARRVGLGDLHPRRAGPGDPHTPGREQKKNLTIIGGGVSERAGQHVHIRETPGFNIGVAGPPPKLPGARHSRRTPGVFFGLVIGPDAVLPDRPGFAGRFVPRGSISDDACANDARDSLEPMRGHWKPGHGWGETVSTPGDTCAVPAGLVRRPDPSKPGEAGLFRARNGADPAGAARNCRQRAG